MNLLEMLLFLVAAVFFGVAAFWGVPRRPHWGWLGACVMALAFVLPEILAAT